MSEQSSPARAVQPSPPPSPTAERSGLRWPASVAAVIMLLTLVPYLIAAAGANGRHFLWLGNNIDDSCVYLSWMRQAQDGSFRAYNLFTTDPQQGMLLNPFFLLLGRTAGLLHLPLIGVYHGARLLFGFLLLLVVWNFLTLTLRPLFLRRLAFVLIATSSGLGWLPLWWDGGPVNPIDKWQPEAITFLSLYLSPLFCFSMWLQVLTLTLLLRAERERRVLYAFLAGGCGLLLALTHTYDVVSLALVWFAYLVGSIFWRSRAERNAPSLLTLRLLYAGIAGSLTVPGVAYIASQLQAERVFRQRADVLTLSPPLSWLLLGYGFVVLLACIGAFIALQRPPLSHTSESPIENGERPDNFAVTTGHDATRLLLVWAVFNVAASYLPTTFQRKMLQGAHIPLATLAAIGLGWLLIRNASRPPASDPPGRDSSEPSRLGSLRLFVPIAVLLLSLTNVRFVLRELTNFADNRTQTAIHRPYLQPGEASALDWIAANTPPNAIIQPLFWQSRRLPHGIDETLACLTPGWTHRAVYCGHWGETPAHDAKRAEVLALGRPELDDTQRLGLLRKMGATYLIFSQKQPNDADTDRLFPMFRGQVAPPPYLQQVYSNPDADVYRVVLP